MTKCKECQKRFNEITKGKENQGYADWKKWVSQEVKDYNEEKMQNLIKRYEIGLKKAKEDDGFRFFSIVAQIVTIFTVMIPFMGNVVLTAINIYISAYNFDGDEQLMQEFVNIVSNITQETGSSLITVTGVYFLVLCLVLILAKHIDAASLGNRSKNKIYYEELLVVLKENLEEKVQSASIDNELLGKENG